MVNEMLAPIPIGSTGSSEGIAGTIAYLFSGDSSYVTGQLIAIDGGWSVS